MIGGLVNEILGPGDEPPAVRVRMLLGQPVAGPAHVDEELGPRGGRVRRDPLPPLGPGHVGHEDEYRDGGGEAGPGHEGQVEQTEPAAQRALGQAYEGLAGELLVGADDLLAVELEGPGAAVAAALLGPQDVPEPVDRAVADEGIAADPQTGEPVDGELRRLEGGQVAAAQRDPPASRKWRTCI